MASSGSPESLSTAVGGYVLKPNSLYVAAYGGASADIAQAIFTKKGLGCDDNGSTTVTVTDDGPTSNPYVTPKPTYDISFEIPTAVPILISISIHNNSGVPSNATTLIQTAVLAAFNGTDGGQRARIGSQIFASRFVSGIIGLGSWAQVYDVQIGVSVADQTSVLMQIDQVPTLSASDISVAYN